MLKLRTIISKHSYFFSENRRVNWEYTKGCSHFHPRWMGVAFLILKGDNVGG
ncbi:hypothetical protein LGL55_04755 [Clostridium tagluense]|uniref:hypothetical protein n=1 Tax=Clostridium TaxID=1485 RepID=UPI0013E99BF6|nr:MULTISPECIES: hypothetical protein [Clostridium]MBZ9625601.1 hypothetical protein [Clostridium sp. FP2]MCB2320256.1 hypothetical protein [Clostridium tagluense]MCB2363524.1 hypothetical protein [Clostridium tagluense]